ncbi:MAG: glutamine amidotransferase-related protein, partial [Chroococcidiopsis sp.]
SHDDVIMGIEHREMPIAAVQFHPESIMTLTGDIGLKIVTNIVGNYAKLQASKSISPLFPHSPLTTHHSPLS